MSLPTFNGTQSSNGPVLKSITIDLLTPAQQEAVALRRRIDELERKLAGALAELAAERRMLDEAVLGQKNQP